MMKQFIVAFVASTVLVNGASVAFAAKGLDSDNSSSSTTVAARPNNDNKADREKRMADKKATRAAKVLKTVTAKKRIMATFKTAMAKATKAKYTALKSAKTNTARKAATRAFNIAVANATRAKTTALKALTSSQTTTTTTTTTVKP